MATLRERVREVLSAREPSEREAARDLATILERAKGGRPTRRRVAWPVLLAPALVAAALIFFLVRRGPSPSVPVAAKTGVHLYLNIAGDSADRAIAIDLDSKGEL
ncbi:MAG: hypothetical protein JWO86_5610 [Myxococcaceae bacterium]|nr:hypothetical protein [Myxococcaceae bacterium]